VFNIHDFREDTPVKTIRVLCISTVLLAAVQANADVPWSEQKVTAPDGTANT